MENAHDRTRLPRPGDADRDARRHLHRRADQLHAAVPRAHLRLLRPGARGVRPRVLPDHRHDEGGAARRGAALHLHGLPHRAGRADGAAVQRLPHAARADPRRAVRGGDPDRDGVRHGHRHRRRGGDGARHHGGPDHDQDRLRRQALRRLHHRRRHARHPDPALGDADRDGAGDRRFGGRALLGGVRPRLPARRHLPRLPDHPLEPQSEARPAGADGGPGELADAAGQRGADRRGAAARS